MRAARRKLAKLFKKQNSKFYWYDFTVRGHRYRGSTQETKSVRAVKAASLKLASVMESTDPLPSKPTALCEFAGRFLAWVDDGRLEAKTKKFYRNGWRLLKATPVADLRVNQITGDFAEQTGVRRSGTPRPFPSRSRRRIRKRRTVTGTRSSAMAARKASVVGARTAGTYPGRSPRAH